jgi:hypothetical protein
MANKKNISDGANSLLKKLKKTSSIEESCVFSESDLYLAKDDIATPIPIINLALSGKFFGGGVSRGSTVISGESRTFKTVISLLCLKAYLDKYEDAVGMIYDSEFSMTPEYLKTFDIDIDRVFISPITDLDVLKNDIINQIDSIERNEKVFILIDSIGNLASLKEISDAQDGKSTVDMTRAKVIKSFFRMIIPRVNLKEIPLFTVNHVYMTQELYSKAIISGGTGVMLGANSAIIMSRRKSQNKEEEGYEFVMTIEKSRFIKEKLKFVLTVPKSGSIKKWSGMFDLASDYKYITSTTQGWYECPALDGIGKVRKKDLEYNDEFWNRIFTETNFAEVVEKDICVSQDQSQLFDSIDDLLKETDCENGQD